MSQVCKTLEIGDWSSRS